MAYINGKKVLTVNGTIYMGENLNVDATPQADTSAHILAFTENKGIYVGTDTGHWYGWDGTHYVDSGVYQAVGIGNKEINGNNLNNGLSEYIHDEINIYNGYIDSATGYIYVVTDVSTNSSLILPIYFNSGDQINLLNSPYKIFRVAKVTGYYQEGESLTTLSYEVNINKQTYTFEDDGYYVIQIVLLSTTLDILTQDILNDIKDKFTIVKSVKEINKYKNDIVNFYTKPNYVIGNVNMYGDLLLGSTTLSNIVIGIFDNTKFNKLKISVDNNYQINYVRFNHSTGVYVDRGSWSTTEIILNNDYDVYILGANVETLSNDEENVYNAIHIEVDDNITYSNMFKTSQFLANINSCDFIGGNIHISIDDVYLSFKDLIDNTPTSIFDNSFFGWLKTIHDTYGFVFTLNCFNVVSSASYDIANVPNTWASEFQANKNWLRFAFHSGLGSDNYNTATTFNADYTKFVTQIYRITGTYDCIDTFTRLGYFGGKLTQIKSYKGNYKPIGLLSADDTRRSYYLTNKDNNNLMSNGKFYDVKNELIFVRSNTRLDSVSASSVISEIESNPKYNKYIEIFFHEQSFYSGQTFVTKITNDMINLYNYVNPKGYYNKFLMDIFKV